MQPNTVTIDNSEYRIFTDENGVNFPAAAVNTYALRRIFNLSVGTPKTIDFTDLTGFWEIESCYISSPDDSELQIEILDSNGLPFFQKTLARQLTPLMFPVVLLNNTLSIKLTAGRNNINLALLYLKPAYLSQMRDF